MMNINKYMREDKPIIEDSFEIKVNGNQAVGKTRFLNSIVKNSKILNIEILSFDNDKHQMVVRLLNKKEQNV